MQFLTTYYKHQEQDFMHAVGLAILGMVFVFLWSSGWTASHYVVNSAGALGLLSARYVIVFLLLLVIVTVLRQWQRMARRDFMVHLLIGALCHALYLLGSISAFELGVSAAVVAFVNALQPMATASFAGVVTGEYIQSRHCKGLLLGMLSVVLIVSDSYYYSGVSSIALALPFIAMLALSTGLVINRRQEIKANSSGQPAKPVMLLLLVHTTGALIVILPLAAVKGQLQWQFTNTEWGAIAWLALVVSLGSYALLLFLLRHLSAVRVSSLTYLVPPATMLQSYFMFGEVLSMTDFIALCIASVAVYMILSNSTTMSTSRRTSMSSAQLARLRLDRISRQPVRLDIEL